MPSDTYRGYTIDFAADRGDAGPGWMGCYLDVRQDGRDVFSLDMLVSNRLAIARYGLAITGGQHAEITSEYGLRWAHGLIDLGRFEEGARYEERRTPEWDPLFGMRDFTEDDLRYHLLLVLRRKLRTSIASGQNQHLDTDGIADVLGIRVNDLRGVLGELLLEGLAQDDGATVGTPPENGACAITGLGLAHLREVRAAAAAMTPFVTVDDIDSFARVREVPPADVLGLLNDDGLLEMPEDSVKHAICAIIGEQYVPRDWGGERSDVFTTRVEYRGRRVPTAMLLKGPAAGAVLYPSGLGKRGDQDMRLFTEPAWLMVVQFNGKIDSAVHQRLWTLAQHRAMQGDRPTICVVDGVDTARLLRAYGQL